MCSTPLYLLFGDSCLVLETVLGRYVIFYCVMHIKTKSIMALFYMCTYYISPLDSPFDLMLEMKSNHTSVLLYPLWQRKKKGSAMRYLMRDGNLESKFWIKCKQNVMFFESCTKNFVHPLSVTGKEKKSEINPRIHTHKRKRREKKSCLTVIFTPID